MMNRTLRFMGSRRLFCSSSLVVPHTTTNIGLKGHPSFTRILSELECIGTCSFEDYVVKHKKFTEQISCFSPRQILSSLETLASINDRQRTLGLVGDIFGVITNDSFSALSHFSSQESLALIKVCGKLKVYDSEIFTAMEQQIWLSSIDDLMIVVRTIHKLNDYDLFRDTISKYLACHSVSILHAHLCRVVIPLLRYGVFSSSPDIVKLCMDSFHEKTELIKKDKDLLVSRSLVTSADVYYIVTLLGRFARSSQLEDKPMFQLSETSRDDIIYCCKSVVGYELRNWGSDQLFKFFFAMSELNLFDDYFVRRRLVPAIHNVIMSSSAQVTEKEKELIKIMTRQLPFRNTMVEEMENLVSHSN